MKHAAVASAATRVAQAGGGVQQGEGRLAPPRSRSRWPCRRPSLVQAEHEARSRRGRPVRNRHLRRVRGWRRSASGPSDARRTSKSRSRTVGCRPPVARRCDVLCGPRGLAVARPYSTTGAVAVGPPWVDCRSKVALITRRGGSIGAAAHGFRLAFAAEARRSCVADLGEAASRRWSTRSAPSVPRCVVTDVTDFDRGAPGGTRFGVERFGGLRRRVRQLQACLASPRRSSSTAEDALRPRDGGQRRGARSCWPSRAAGDARRRRHDLQLHGVVGLLSDPAASRVRDLQARGRRADADRRSHAESPPVGIRVNSIPPGPGRQRLQHSMWPRSALTGEPRGGSRRRALRGAHPARSPRRRAEEIARSVLFLASDEPARS